MEGATGRGCARAVWDRLAWQAVGTRGGPEDTAHEDRRTDAGERFFRLRSARPPSERTAMIDRGHKLPLTRQAAVVGISRGSLYIMLHVRCLRPNWRSCGGSTHCISTIRSRAAGCCVPCCAAKSRSGGSRSRGVRRSRRFFSCPGSALPRGIALAWGLHPRFARLRLDGKGEC